MTKLKKKIVVILFLINIRDWNKLKRKTITEVYYENEL